MNHRLRIESTFGLQALNQPVFYNNPGGLRFELTNDHELPITSFLTTHKKAADICRDVFHGTEMLLLCGTFNGPQNGHGLLRVARSLASLNLWHRSPKQHWFQAERDDPDNGQHAIAYETTIENLDSILWSNLAQDFGIIEPRAECLIHLFDFKQNIQVCVYDDRGMDVVGPNHSLLKALYTKYQANLLRHDIDRMNDTFKPATH